MDKASTVLAILIISTENACLAVYLINYICSERVKEGLLQLFQ